MMDKVVVVYNIDEGYNCDETGDIVGVYGIDSLDIIDGMDTYFGYEVHDVKRITRPDPKLKPYLVKIDSTGQVEAELGYDELEAAIGLRWTWRDYQNGGDGESITVMAMSEEHAIDLVTKKENMNHD